MSDQLLTTEQAAQLLRVSRRRVLALIKAERLPATHFGLRSWMIRREHLKLVAQRKPGRPRRK